MEDGREEPGHERREPSDVTADRALTDASLDAERSGADAVQEKAIANARRRLDDLIERDRHLADERLMRFREAADRLIERDRLASPHASLRTELERVAADRSIQAEREASDALLHRERGRVDARAALKRQEQDSDRADQESHRQDTNARLSEERSGADYTLFNLGRLSNALVDAQADRARHDDMLAMVTHDLRSPLTVIVANASFISEETTEVVTRDAAEDMLGAAARMGRLLADLLDVARIESGTLRIEKGEHDIGALLTGVLSSYRPIFASLGIRFTIRPPEAPVCASIDHDRVVQLLSNLLGNAMKFTPQGGHVELRAEARDGEVALVVHDSGPGIDPEALPHVFDRFWKVKDDGQQGLGLGLYICRSIAEAHGGSMSVESSPGHGTAFRVSLPDSSPGAKAA